jgi:hypothetical protein
MSTKQLDQFPGAAQIGRFDLIFMSQSGVAVAATPAQMATFIMSALVALPTTLPAQSGVLWNNGGIVSIS